VGDPSRGPAEAAFRAVNVDGTRRLIDAARARPVVWVSSGSVYDPRPDRGLVSESHPIGGQLTAYGRTKAEGERLALAAGAVVLRPRAVYGRGDPHLLPRIRRGVRAGLALLPGPDVRLSLTAMENLADACLAAIAWPQGAYNVADAEPYWRDASIRAVLAAHGIRARVVHIPAAVAMSAARVTQLLAGLAPSWVPALTPYSVDQVAHSVVLDISKALAQGWRPRWRLADYLANAHAFPRPI